MPDFDVDHWVKHIIAGQMKLADEDKIFKWRAAKKGLSKKAMKTKKSKVAKAKNRPAAKRVSPAKSDDATVSERSDANPDDLTEGDEDVADDEYATGGSDNEDLIDTLRKQMKNDAKKGEQSHSGKGKRKGKGKEFEKPGEKGAVLKNNAKPALNDVSKSSVKVESDEVVLKKSISTASEECYDQMIRLFQNLSHDYFT
jgi:hypothetical protein